MSGSFSNNSKQQIPPSSAVARRHANRNQRFPYNIEREQTGSHRSRPYFNEQHDQRSSTRAAYASRTASTATSSYQLPLSDLTLTQMLNKQPNEILAQMLQPNFPLKKFLNDKRTETQNDWIVPMTKLFERITTCADERSLCLVFEQIPNTVYVEGVYNAVRQVDSKTNQLHFDMLQSFLHMSNRFLALAPHLASHITKIFERIELSFTKINSNTLESISTKVILDKVLERVAEIERPKQPNQPLQIETITTTNQFDDNTELDDYRQLPIVPNVQEILSGNRPVLQKNIIDGIYNDHQHYLDIHFRLLREDFVGPLREGIQHYLSGSPDKNYNVRIYQNVRSKGPKLNPRSGIVYELCLDRQMASKIFWANSRRLMYGNLLVLTHDNFQTCAFVTIEDRKDIERTFCISVRTLENINNFNQAQINLGEIDPSCSLTMIETTTFFEAYRPVLNALQTIGIDQAFPLEPFILKSTNENIPPNYVTQTTTYDFTPLLVEPGSKVKAVFTIKNTALDSVNPFRSRRFRPPILNFKFQINYEQSAQVAAKYKSVNLLDSNQWPTGDELHLNSKQREALMSTLTRKVALIQGPPGTGKTYLGVRIAEMLLYNRSVWSPPFEQSTPILMICQTNHALDQFLELIKIRLNLEKGIIRVGSRCKNEAIKPFSLSDARNFFRINRYIPSDIYSQKTSILGKKIKCDKTLTLENYKIKQSRADILSLSSFNKYYIVDRKHCSSLYAHYKNVSVETVMLDWLGLDHDYRNSLKEVFYLRNLQKKISQLEVDLDQETNEQLIENFDQSEIATDRVEQNEEEEEEERRRDETELDDEYFASSIVNKPITGNSKKTTSTRISSANEYEDGYRSVTKKPHNCHQLIKSIIECPTTLTDETVHQLPNNLWKLKKDERYDLYRYWLLKYQNYCHDSIRVAQQEYNQTIAELTKYKENEDYYILKDSVIVAMTTTCAAKYHAVLEKLQSKIVIVEEAAAIFEAHIITALSSKCEHLILIGDHIQLRPNPSNYRLGENYHLDVSLFERFVRNKFPSVRLNIQHRMRPEIARLMKHFYDDLEDHISVLNERPKIQGVENSVFFINHNHLETKTVDGGSKINEFEARYVIELAKYLIKQGYRPDQITVLVMYLGQRQHIAKLVKPVEFL